MNARAFLNWAICGYREDRENHCCCFTRGWRINLDTRRGSLWLRLLDMERDLRNTPRSARWWLADRFSRWALRLRGEKLYRFGYYDDSVGNRAAKLAWDVDWRLMRLFSHDETDDYLEAQEQLNELAAKAGSTWADGRRFGPPSPAWRRRGAPSATGSEELQP